MKNFKKRVATAIAAAVTLITVSGCTANTVDRPRPSQPGNEKVTTTTGFVAKNKAQDEWLKLKAMATREGRTAHFDERFGGIMPRGLTKDSTGADLMRMFESFGWPSSTGNFVVSTTMEKDINNLWFGQVIIDSSSVLVEHRFAKIYVIYEDREGHLAVSMPIEVAVNRSEDYSNLTYRISKMVPYMLKQTIQKLEDNHDILPTNGASLYIR